MKKILAVVLVAVLALAFCACFPEKQIIGTWKNQETVLGVVVETTYVFNEDGTGTMSVGNVVPVELEYSFKDDKLNITVNTLGIKTTTEYSFDFKGDELTLTNGSNSIKLVKQK